MNLQVLPFFLLPISAISAVHAGQCRPAVFSLLTKEAGQMPTS